MSVDKTIEELSYTLAQLGSLVGHINAQIVGVTARINMTLDTFDNSVTVVAGDASAMTNQVALTVSQIPNAWLFYLLFLSITTVFVLLSIVLLLKMILNCYGIYKLCKENTTNSGMSKSVILPIYKDVQPFVASSPEITRVRPDHVSINMEHEPRRIGIIANGDIEKSDEDTHKAYQRKLESNGGRYSVQTGVTLPFSTHGAEV